MSLAAVSAHTTRTSRQTNRSEAVDQEQRDKTFSVVTKTLSCYLPVGAVFHVADYLDVFPWEAQLQIMKAASIMPNSNEVDVQKALEIMQIATLVKHSLEVLSFVFDKSNLRDETRDIAFEYNVRGRDDEVAFVSPAKYELMNICWMGSSIVPLRTEMCLHEQLRLPPIKVEILHDDGSVESTAYATADAAQRTNASSYIYLEEHCVIA